MCEVNEVRTMSPSRRPNKLLSAFHRATIVPILSRLLLVLHSPSRSEVVHDASRTPRNTSQFEQMALANTSNFYELVVNEIYVDKTLMITKLADPVVRITYPKGWGKSTNLNMIKRFFEIEIDREGSPLPEEERVNPKLFFGGKLELDFAESVRLKPLKIASTSYASLLGKYPVIYVSFKEAVGDTYRAIENKMKHLMVSLFRQHGYLRWTLRKEEETYFYMYYLGNIDEADIYNSLKYLCRLVREHFGQNVYILIDDYDTPIIDLFVNLIGRIKSKSRHLSYKEVFDKAAKSDQLLAAVSLVQGTLSNGLKNNEWLKQAVITGTYVIQFADLFGGFNIDVLYGLADRQDFLEYYGFTEEEVNAMLSEVSFKPDLEDVRSWYGYVFTNERKFNPWSIRHFLANKGKFGDYWLRGYGFMYDNEDTPCTSLARYASLSNELQSKLRKLVAGKQLGMHYHTSALNFAGVANDLKVLLFSGYLNTESVQERCKVHGISIANRVIESELKDRILEWTCDKFKVTRDDFEEMTERLGLFEVKEFEKKLQTLLLEVPMDAVEAYDYYGGLVNSMLYYLEKDYMVDREQEDEYSFRPEYILISYKRANKKRENAILMESKIIQYVGELEDRWFDETNRKFAEVNVTQYFHIKRVLKIIFIFCGKIVNLKYNIDDNIDDDSDNDIE